MIMNEIIETVKNRALYYSQCRYADVYTLYSERSELRQFFQSPDAYIAHVVDHCQQSIFLDMEIVSQKVRGGLGEVCFNERFSNGECVLCYFTKSILVLEYGEWKILKEERVLKSDD